MDAALREAPCEPFDLIFPDENVERINEAKGGFKIKTLAFEPAAALILEKIKGPTATAKAILDTFNITVTPQ